MSVGLEAARAWIAAAEHDGPPPPEAMFPEWPRVRCSSCGKAYTLSVAQLAARPVVGRCPRCGRGRFNTYIRPGGGS